MTKAPRIQRTDGDATRARILEAAGAMFSELGFAETSSKAIAARAEVDLASINYHFGSRAGLYEAVLVEAHRRLVDVADLRRLAERGLSADATLRALLELLVPRSAEPAQSWHLQALARELVAPSSHIQVLYQFELMPKLSTVRELLGAMAGIPADAPAMVRCLVSVAAPCLMMLIASRGLPGPLKEVSAMPRQTVIDHFHIYAMAGLKAVGADYRAREISPTIDTGK